MFEWFVLGFFIGVVAPVAGVGDAVLSTPLALAFTGLDVNAVRAAGLLLAMTDSAVAGRRYLKAGATELGLVVFVAAFMSIGVLAGAVLGLYAAEVGKVGVAALRVALGVLLFAALYLTTFVKPRDGTTKSLQRPALTAASLFGVGLLSGGFGLGAGWALVPVLNLVASLPLRVAVATSASTFVLADAAGFLAYSHALVPAVAAPLALGAAVGAHLGSWLGLRLRVRVLRWVVAGVLAVAGVQLVLRGLAELYG